MTGGNKNEDFDMDSFSDSDSDFDDLFKEGTDGREKNLFDELDGVISPRIKGDAVAGTRTPPLSLDSPRTKKRTAQDFEPDMDALLMTAQSSMIIEGMRYFTNKNFTADAHSIYLEALKGVEFYIKILDRNPNNYRKLKSLIDSDTDCQQVEKIAFNLFKKTYDDIAETDREKISAFELLYKLIKGAVNKTTITKSMQTIKKYYLMSGDINTEKVQECLNSGDIGFKTEVKNLHEHIKIALDLLKKGKTEIAAGMKGKDINVYIINTSALLSYIYKLQGNAKVSDYYGRINNIHKKYFIVQE